MTQELIFHDAQERFSLAIAAGCLSSEPGGSNYAGDYMYMGTQGDTDLFKHRMTRLYRRHTVGKAAQS
jgi:hypothetical protein